MNILVIGAGIFGSVVALVLSENKRHNVTLVEESNDILDKASKHNHNRLHLGFHYPRSIETAKQSVTGLVSFFINFKEAINNNFPKYYLIERTGKTTPEQFINFCDEMNLFYKEEWPDVSLNRENILLSVLTEEPGFDYDIIKQILKEKFAKSKVNIIFNKSISTKSDCEIYDVVINCTYAGINKISNIFNINPLTLKHQDVFIPIIKLDIKRMGLTIMDGPFCSVMPFGFNKNQYLLYHVKHSVLDQQIGFDYNHKNINSNYETILNESLKYYTFLNKAEYLNYYRTTRVLPINDNDERVTDFTVNNIDDKKIITVLSGKVSTCWDTAYQIKKLLQ
jgi:hypothetical protein